MFEKSRFRRPFHKEHDKRAEKTVGIFTSAALPYLLISVNIIELAKVYFSALKNVKTVNTLTADDKYSLVDRENKRQQIQILLSQKQNTFSQFFSAFLKSTLNFEHF